MKTIKKVIVAAGVVAAINGFVLAGNTFAATKEYIVRVGNQVTGEGASSALVTYELQNIDGTVVSSKTSSESEIAFDPIVLDESDTASYFYKIIQKDGSSSGISHDSKVVYVRIKPSEDLLAYQDDTTYKYVNDGSGPHPYHATDAELQGQAYAVYDSTTKTLTFFRDEENKYTDKQIDGTKTYYTDFELANADHPDDYGAYIPSFGYSKDWTVANNVETIIFRDAIRPEGAMKEWFYLCKKLKSIDLKKLDTSRVTAMPYFLYESRDIDPDIRTLDFSKIVETIQNSSTQSLDHFMKYAGITEFDFNNFAAIDAPTKYPIGEMMLASQLRYLNTTNLAVGGSSSEFNQNLCLERLVVGDKYSFYRSNLDYPSYGKDWLKIETGRIDKANNMIQYKDGIYNGDPNPEAKGNYVRPTCNTTPAVFKSTYKKPAEKKDDIVNPATDDELEKLIVIGIASVIMLIAAGISYIIEKRRA